MGTHRLVIVAEFTIDDEVAFTASSPMLEAAPYDSTLASFQGALQQRVAFAAHKAWVDAGLQPGEDMSVKTDLSDGPINPTA